MTTVVRRPDIIVSRAALDLEQRAAALNNIYCFSWECSRCDARGHKWWIEASYAERNARAHARRFHP